jgi:hypothetical protein
LFTNIRKKYLERRRCVTRGERNEVARLISGVLARDRKTLRVPRHAARRIGETGIR